ncbi:MAG: cytochrome c oxidase subunit II [bacterium]
MSAGLSFLLNAIERSRALRTSFWMPEPGSAYAADVDWLFQFILGIAIFFFGLIVVLLVVFVIRYRQRPGHHETVTETHNMLLELTWTIIPLILVIVIFYFGFRSYMDLATPPQNALEIHVEGQRWSWLFTYPNGHVDSTLHVPINVPVRIIITSTDVIHSLYIPVFRIKMDAVPGRYQKMWFQATVAGDFPVYCAEYCGKGHSDMTTRVFVHQPGGYEAWLADTSDIFKDRPLKDVGELLSKQRGCVQCHSLDGKANVGPTWKNAFGKMRALANGPSVMFDENYVRESILNPQAKVTVGFQAVMPTFQGKLKDKEIDALIEYIKSLSAEQTEKKLP